MGYITHLPTCPLPHLAIQDLLAKCLNFFGPKLSNPDSCMPKMKLSGLKNLVYAFEGGRVFQS